MVSLWFSRKLISKKRGFPRNDAQIEGDDPGDFFGAILYHSPKARETIFFSQEIGPMNGNSDK